MNKLIKNLYIGWIFLFLILISPQLFADAIPANRITAWKGNVGVEGGIPTVTNIYTTLSPSTTLSALNTALANCPSNQVVLLSPGTYTFSGQININGKNGVVLRGSGVSNTLIKANIQVQGSSASIVWSGPAGVLSWTGGYTQGGSNITLSSVSGLSVGQMIVLDQLNDNDDVCAANAWETTGTSIAGCSGASGAADCSRECGNRAQQQYTMVKAINGNTVTIWPPLYMPNWASGRTPQVAWVSGLAQKVGIEDLSIDCTANSGGAYYGASISFWNTWNCWVKNIRSTNSLGGAGGESCHVHFQQSGRGEIRHSIFNGTRAAQSMSYGNLILMVSGMLIENNAYYGIYAPVMISYGASGNAVAYNYASNNYTGESTLSGAVWFHAAHVCMTLMEGNHFDAIRADYFHGSGSHQTAFRNRLTGYEPNKSGKVMCFCIENTNRYWNLVGNICGTAGSQTVADSIVGVNTAQDHSVYYVGWNAQGGDDTKTGTSLYRHGNWDNVNNSIIWASSNADHTLPNSYLYDSKPSWFGAKSWPPFDPATPASISPTNLPSAYLFYYGVDTADTNSGTGGGGSPYLVPPRSVHVINMYANTVISGGGTTTNAVITNNPPASANNIVLINTNSYGTSSTAATNVSWTTTFNSDTTNGYFILGINIWKSSSALPVNVYLDSTPLSLITNYTPESGTISAVYGKAIGTISSGSHTIKVHLAATGYEFAGVSSTWNNVSNATAIAVATGSGSPASVNVTSSTSDQIISILRYNDIGSASPSETLAVQIINSSTAEDAGMSYKVGTGTSESMSWTGTSSSWGLFAISLKSL